jgi:low affinity Fe/Cu permease
LKRDEGACPLAEIVVMCESTEFLDPMAAAEMARQVDEVIRQATDTRKDLRRFEVAAIKLVERMADEHHAMAGGQSDPLEFEQNMLRSIESGGIASKIEFVLTYGPAFDVYPDDDQE